MLQYVMTLSNASMDKTPSKFIFNLNLNFENLVQFKLFLVGRDKEDYKSLNLQRKRENNLRRIQVGASPKFGVVGQKVH